MKQPRARGVNLSLRLEAKFGAEAALPPVYTAIVRRARATYCAAAASARATPAQKIQSGHRVPSSVTITMEMLR